MYFYTKFLINDKKYYSKKLQNAQIYYQREDSRRIYDTTIRIEQQIANVLEIEEKGKFFNYRIKNLKKSISNKKFNGQCLLPFIRKLMFYILFQLLQNLITF